MLEEEIVQLSESNIMADGCGRSLIKKSSEMVKCEVTSTEVSRRQDDPGESIIKKRI